PGAGGHDVRGVGIDRKESGFEDLLDGVSGIGLPGGRNSTALGDSRLLGGGSEPPMRGVGGGRVRSIEARASLREPVTRRRSPLDRWCPRGGSVFRPEF